jgi:hypothetical protein
MLSVLVIARYEAIAEDLSYQEIASLSLAMTRRRSSSQPTVMIEGNCKSLTEGK